MSTTPADDTTPAPASEFLSAQEAADYLRMSLAWVRLRTHDGTLPHIKPSGRTGRVLYAREDLRRFALGHRRGGRKAGAA